MQAEAESSTCLVTVRYALFYEMYVELQHCLTSPGSCSNEIFQACATACTTIAN